MYPLLLSPEFKDYIWGGTKLRTDFNKTCDFEKIAESWELACHKDGNSTITNGEFKGLTLAQYIDKCGKAVLGENCEKFSSFPILIKLIDAKDNLSVQVHPDNDFALANEGEYGKTEMWYIVDCEPNSELIFGLAKEISKEDFAKRINDNTLLDVVKKVPVKKGDTFFIKSGTLHAIGKGIVIAEIQQNSNTTYRVYDYGRVDANGKFRELHIEKAVSVTDLFPAKIENFGVMQTFDGYTLEPLASCEYFDANRLEINEVAKLIADNNSFHSILVLDGSAELIANGEIFDIKKGNSIFIPAGFGDYLISGECEIILTKI
ncbi:MAG: type I phosphomannose isomerase catalytic subunit [Oscillospiraceae bacterium]